MKWHIIAGIVLMTYTAGLYAAESSVSNLLCALREARWLQEQPSVWDTVHKSAVSDQLVELGKTDQTIRTLLTREFATCFTLFTDSIAAVHYAYRLQRTMELIDPCLLAYAVSNAMVNARWPAEQHGTLLWFLESTRHQDITRITLNDYDALCRNMVIHCATAGTARVQLQALTFLIKPDTLTGLSGLDSQIGKQLALNALNSSTSIVDQIPIVSILSASKDTRHTAAQWLRRMLEDKAVSPLMHVALCKMFEEDGIVTTQDLQAAHSARQQEVNAMLERMKRDTSERAKCTNSTISTQGGQAE